MTARDTIGRIAFAAMLLSGCASKGPLTMPSAGLAPAGVDPGASGGFADPGGYGLGPYSDPSFDNDDFGGGFGDVGF